MKIFKAKGVKSINNFVFFGSAYNNDWLSTHWSPMSPLSTGHETREQTIVFCLITQPPATTNKRYILNRRMLPDYH